MSCPEKALPRRVFTRPRQPTSFCSPRPSASGQPPYQLVQIQKVYWARPIDAWCDGVNEASRPVWPDLCGQRFSDTADNLPIQEHPEMADAAYRYGFSSGLGRYRPNAGHDHVECGRKCHPANVVGYRR
jgi:hypothetical protein